MLESVKKLHNIITTVCVISALLVWH